MRILITALMLISLSTAAAAEKNTILLSDSSTCTFERNNGMLEGDYKSFYKNGKLKCEGSFLQNNRFGVWAFYKTNGSIQCMRDYRNNYNYSERNSANQLKQITWNPQNSWTPIYECDIIHKKRYLTTVTLSENKSLFETESLIKGILKVINESRINLFTDSRFTTVIDKNILNNVTIVGFTLKEDKIIDQTTKCLHQRIIGIAPLVYSMDQQTNKELCWIYYPDIKSSLGKIFLNTPSRFAETLLDIFENRIFAGVSIPLMLPGIITNEDETECMISMIEKENTYILSNFTVK